MAWNDNSRRARFAAVGSVAALGVGLSAGVAQAGSSSSHVQKVPLTTANINCDGSPAGGQGSGPGGGFVTYNRPANGNVIANVVVQDARPNTTYNVRLIQAADSSDCGSLDGVITTDAFGAGSVNVHETVAAGATVFVAVNNAADPFSDYLTTGTVTP